MSYKVLFVIPNVKSEDESQELLDKFHSVFSEIQGCYGMYEEEGSNESDSSKDIRETNINLE